MASPFVGSRIRLISKRGVRYEGMFHSINQEELTIGLSKVRVFGTEGRESRADEAVGPSEETYPFIEFRSSDILELSALQPIDSSVETSPVVPSDPAIVSSSNIAPPVDSSSSSVSHSDENVRGVNSNRGFARHPGSGRGGRGSESGPWRERAGNMRGHSSSYSRPRNQGTYRLRENIDIEPVDTEFDFISANARLEKEKLESDMFKDAESKSESASSIAPGYDATVDFFDNLDLGEKISDAGHVKDSHTFGSKATYSYFHEGGRSRGRGRGRGGGRGRGRGGARGQGNWRGHGGRGGRGASSDRSAHSNSRIASAPPPLMTHST